MRDMDILTTHDVSSLGTRPMKQIHTTTVLHLCLNSSGVRSMTASSSHAVACHAMLCHAKLRRAGRSIISLLPLLRQHSSTAGTDASRGQDWQELANTYGPRHIYMQATETTKTQHLAADSVNEVMRE